MHGSILPSALRSGGLHAGVHALVSQIALPVDVEDRPRVPPTGSYRSRVNETREDP